MEGNMLLKLWAKKEAFVRSEEGATAIEYGLIAAGIAVAISAIVFTMGDSLIALFTNVSGKVDTAAAK
jgi:pilus assembly protein Flp/PilA